MSSRPKTVTQRLVPLSLTVTMIFAFVLRHDVRVILFRGVILFRNRTTRGSKIRGSFDFVTPAPGSRACRVRIAAHKVAERLITDCVLYANLRRSLAAVTDALKSTRLTRAHFHSSTFAIDLCPLPAATRYWQSRSSDCNGKYEVSK